MAPRTGPPHPGCADEPDEEAAEELEYERREDRLAKIAARMDEQEDSYRSPTHALREAGLESSRSFPWEEATTSSTMRSSRREKWKRVTTAQLDGRLEQWADQPAPHAELPDRNLSRIPTELRQQRMETGIDRMMNSTVGRLILFATTLVFLCLAALGLVAWRSPAYRLNGASLPILAAAACCLVVVYCVVPAAGKRAGLEANVDGYDWKPYFVCFRAAYISALPGLVLIACGFGEKSGFGLAAGVAGTVTMASLRPGSLEYFETSDGFVALNLTKGVVETLTTSTHGPADSLRVSRFRDAELRINTEPFSDVPEPTVPPGAMMIYRIAPIFSSWAPCVTLYDISQQCLVTNPVVGWAFTKTQTLCSSFHMVSCLRLDSELDPVYRCSSSPTRGQGIIANISGLCGRVASAPPPAVVDELSAILKHAGWGDDTLPTTSQVWVDVQPDDCIADPQSCISRWDSIGLAGLVLFVLSLLCIVLPAVMDFRFDRRIRDALAFYELKRPREATG